MHLLVNIHAYVHPYLHVHICAHAFMYVAYACMYTYIHPKKAFAAQKYVETKYLNLWFSMSIDFCLCVKKCNGKIHVCMSLCY